MKRDIISFKRISHDASSLPSLSPHSKPQTIIYRLSPQNQALAFKAHFSIATCRFILLLLLTVLLVFSLAHAFKYVVVYIL